MIKIMKYFKILIPFLLSIITQLDRYALAESKLIELQKIKDWTIIQKIDSNKKSCHAITKPYRHITLSSSIDDPRFIISYMGKSSYSISFTSSTKLNPKQPVTIMADNAKYILRAGKYRLNATTYSMEQDINIIDSLISGPYSFRIISKGEKNEEALMYFSVLGIQEVILYMESNCKNL
jgi:hypothetical protein